MKLPRIILSAACLAIASCGTSPDEAGERETRVFHDLDTLVRTEIVSDRENWSGDGLFGSAKLQILKAKVTGTPLTLIYPYGGKMCGSGGCSLYIVEQATDGFRLTSRTSQVMLPIKRLPGADKAHPDFSIFLRGYGEPGTRVRLGYDQGRYPPNASMPPAAAISGDEAAPILLDYPDQ